MLNSGKAKGFDNRLNNRWYGLFRIIGNDSVITQSNIYFAKFIEDSTGKSVMNQNDRLETILIETIEAQFDV